MRKITAYDVQANRTMIRYDYFVGNGRSGFRYSGHDRRPDLQFSGHVPSIRAVHQLGIDFMAGTPRSEIARRLWHELRPLANAKRRELTNSPA